MSPVPPATSSSRHGRPAARRIERAHQRVLPQPVQAARHQVVHQVVAARDAVEHVVDQRLLVRRRRRSRSRRRRCHSCPRRRFARMSRRDHSGTGLAAPLRPETMGKARDARASGGRDGAARAGAGAGGGDDRAGRAAAAGSALSLSARFASAPDRPAGDRAPPPRQISAGRARRRHGAPHASRHVRLVPRSRRQVGSRVAGEPSITSAARTRRTTMSCSISKGGTRIVYNDPRRFGFMLLIAPAALDAHPLLAGARPGADRQRALRRSAGAAASPAAPRR